MNKINAFLADERMRQMFSAPQSSFQLREIMDQKKHLLIKLDKGKLKGASDLLGSLFMAKIQMTAFSRSNIPAHQRVPFYLYIDEFQNFASESFEVILSEARKYGLSLVMAHQSLSQISESLRGLILASAGIQIYFRVNRQDAQLIAKEVFQYSGFEVKYEGANQPVYWSHGEEWERKIGDLQHLPPRTCVAKHKIQGGAIALYTVGIEPAWEMLGLSEADYLAFAATIPFGQQYLRSRQQLAEQARERQQQVRQTRQAPVPVQEDDREHGQQRIEHPPRSVSAPPLPRGDAVQPSDETATRPRVNVREQIARPQANPTVEREHRRLQHLIKRMAEQHGYRAVIEEATTDGKGRVDVGLARDGRKVACEISVTSTPEQELGNIHKCLASGYERILLCAETKFLRKIHALATSALSEPDQQKVIFLEPEALAWYFEEEAADRAGTEERVKGYKVKVHFQPMEDVEKDTKRKALARVFLQSSQRKEQESSSE
jgi:hypothetical protein